MKKSVLAFALLFPWVAIAQTTSYGNFKLINQEIVYQQVFTHDSITTDELMEHYKTQSFISNLYTTTSGILFEFTDITVDYKKFQFSQVGTPSIIQTGKYSGKGTVDVKDGKYRVTLQSLQLAGDISYKKITSKENLTNYASKNNGTVLDPNWCKPNMLGLLDQAFTDKFKAPVKEKKDW